MECPVFGTFFMLITIQEVKIGKIFLQHSLELLFVPSQIKVVE